MSYLISIILQLGIAILMVSSFLSTGLVILPLIVVYLSYELVVSFLWKIKDFQRYYNSELMAFIEDVNVLIDDRTKSIELIKKSNLDISTKDAKINLLNSSTKSMAMIRAESVPSRGIRGFIDYCLES